MGAVAEGGEFRWNGLMAKNISKDMILSLKTSKIGAAVARDLKGYPPVQEALKATGSRISVLSRSMKTTESPTEKTGTSKNSRR
jgi:hypothetical protein